MAYIGVQPTDTYLSIASQQITGTGSATYTLDYSVSNEEDVAVFVNNVRQNVSTYTVSGTSLTLGGTISASDSCWVLFLGRTVGTKTPAVGSVTNDMLAGSIAISKLADYEEGAWTPTFSQGYTGITYLAQYGWYRKIGNLVSVSCGIQFSATANSTSVRINLPFTQTVRNYGGGGIPFCNISDFANTNPYVGFNQSYLQYYEIGTGTNISSTTSPSSKWISFVISMATS